MTAFMTTFNPQTSHFSLISLTSSRTFELKADKPKNHMFNKTVALWH